MRTKPCLTFSSAPQEAREQPAHTSDWEDGFESAFLVLGNHFLTSCFPISSNLKPDLKPENLVSLTHLYLAIQKLTQSLSILKQVVHSHCFSSTPWKGHLPAVLLYSGPPFVAGAGESQVWLCNVECSSLFPLISLLFILQDLAQVLSPPRSLLCLHWPMIQSNLWLQVGGSIMWFSDTYYLAFLGNLAYVHVFLLK